MDYYITDRIMEYFIQGILSFIKVFEVFGDFLFHPTDVMYTPYS